jgi:hypothetical protein
MIQDKFYLHTSPIETNKTFYCLIKNAGSLSPPQLADLGSGNVWDAQAKEFIELSTVNCGDATQWADLKINMQEENLNCGGSYILELPSELQIPGLHLEILVYEMLGVSAPTFSDTLRSVSSHKTGSVEHTLDVEFFFVGSNTAYIFAHTKQDGRYKDSSGLPTFSVPSPAVLNGTAFHVQEGIYVQAVDTTNVSSSSWITGSVEATMMCGLLQSSGAYQDSPTTCCVLQSSSASSKSSGDSSALVQQLLDRPVISGT